jgi:hypothetical protein
MKVDDRFVAQLFTHWARLDVSECSAYVKYLHKTMVTSNNTYMANLFCEFRDDIERV